MSARRSLPLVARVSVEGGQFADAINHPARSHACVYAHAHAHALRVLVVDEVDRLARQTYQNWLERVHTAAHAPTALGSGLVTARR